MGRCAGAPLVLAGGRSRGRNCLPRACDPPNPLYSALPVKRWCAAAAVAPNTGCSLRRRPKLTRQSIHIIAVAGDVATRTAAARFRTPTMAFHGGRVKPSTLVGPRQPPLHSAHAARSGRKCVSRLAFFSPAISRWASQKKRNRVRAPETPIMCNATPAFYRNV